MVSVPNRLLFLLLSPLINTSMIQNKWRIGLVLLAVLNNACINDHQPPGASQENPAIFKEISSTDLGGEASAEIATYDPV